MTFYQKCGGQGKIFKVLRGGENPANSSRFHIQKKNCEDKIKINKSLHNMLPQDLNYKKCQRIQSKAKGERYQSETWIYKKGHQGR